MGFVIIPAVDIRGGKAVRLAQGDYNRETVYNADPLAAARRWVDAGASRLHLVDLDAAKSGDNPNRDIVVRIAREFDIPVEIGGGVRNLDVVRDYLDAGVRWVIVGTAAVTDPDFVHEAAITYPDRVILGIDAQDGMVKTAGWTESTKVTAVDLARSYADVKIAAIIYTDISRDGVGGGVDLDGTLTMAQKSPFPVIASGGIHTTGDIDRVASLFTDGVAGVIVGRALYEGTLTFEAALEQAERASGG
ncbi:MAG: 1-(5-phosphoribosyl)-5-[(5-phosphoribosylamino)methylideneamino]imidazole-4-carboxamide isomerase [Deltaproteobacteria bacterium]|nr:1-(5-phosphoribosyl)-5-[(5-phosphoribosylamino)methylideneamino]imidazole-4-carboxamide isomerase [Candidatus Zymogenaceae bacterium]